MDSPEFRELDRICARLPFHLNDIDQVNRTFQQWQAAGFPLTESHIEIWTYCYVYRYFLVKFMQESSYAVSDLEALIDLAFYKVQQHRPRLKNPSRYAQWVSVVCKNTYLNYLRARRKVLPLFEVAEIDSLPDGVPGHSDGRILAQALRDAIDRLPQFLREVAYLRFVDGCGYEEIARRTGRPAASIRTYVSKALVRFRKDVHLLAFLERSIG